jgi:hypothetical protein
MASLSIPAAQLRELETLSGLPPGEDALREAASTLVRLARDPIFLDAHVLPLLDEAREVGEWYAARCWEDGSHSLQVFVWPPESRTQVHDYASWEVFCCVVGSVFGSTARKVGPIR